MLNAGSVLASGGVCSVQSGVVEVRKETLEAQINRLAELIGRLENKVRTPTLLKKKYCNKIQKLH